MSKANNKNSRCVIHADNEITIYQAAQIHAQLQERIAACEEIELNLEHVGELDTAGVQILLAAKRAAAAADKKLQLTSHSEAVVQVFELLNIAHEFGDPIVISKP